MLDALTGLKNRRGFERAVQELRASGKDFEGAALLVADVDHFKQVNDTHGHLLGDKVLRAIGGALLANIKAVTWRPVWVARSLRSYCWTPPLRVGRHRRVRSVARLQRDAFARLMVRKWPVR